MCGCMSACTSPQWAFVSCPIRGITEGPPDSPCLHIWESVLVGQPLRVGPLDQGPRAFFAFLTFPRALTPVCAFLPALENVPVYHTSPLRVLWFGFYLCCSPHPGIGFIGEQRRKGSVTALTLDSPTQWLCDFTRGAVYWGRGDGCPVALASALGPLLAVQLDPAAVFGDQSSGGSSVSWFLVPFLLELQVPHLAREPPSLVELRNCPLSPVCF